MAKTIILGHRGYIGPVVAERLKALTNDHEIVGIDINWFAGAEVSQFPDELFDKQICSDVRSLSVKDFQGATAIVHLAAVSNDPMGVSFEKPTMQINAAEVARVAEIAKKAGVSRYTFASSCSMYGAGGKNKRTETDELHPLTAYARSKVSAEKSLKPLASETFKVTALRFATACGPSPMLRLDLVLNDFVATALKTGCIEVLSDGSPWRPLIDVRDMARAIEWAVARSGEDYIAVNVGSDQWTWQIGDLANAVAEALGGVDVSINKEAAPDKRSYRVDFSKFKKLAPNHQPECTIEDSVEKIANCVREINLADSAVRDSKYIRLNILKQKIKNGELNQNLEALK